MAHIKGCKCGVCGAEDEPLVLHSKCHIQSPTWAYLSPDGKTLSIKCATCDKHIATFELVQN